MSGRWAGSRRRAGRTTSGWDEQATAQRILKRDGHHCYLQSRDCAGTATQVDHIRPISQGGTDTDDNKAAICEPCHRAKTARESAAGRARYSRRRPVEPHPGLLDAS